VRVTEWNSDDYLICERQQVTEGDAQALARALARALKKIPKSDSASTGKGTGREVAYFAGYARDGLADFVAYCKRGSFRVTDDVYDE
jgi:hypothetical protein